MIIKIIEIVLIVLALWTISAFLVAIFTIPNFYFIKTRIQRSRKIKEFAKKLKGRRKEETLKNIYNYLISNYKGKEERWKVVSLFYKWYYLDIEKLIGKKQFLPCHLHNRVFMTLLINLGFKEDNFQRKVKISRFLTPHQYLIVDIGRKYKIDLFMRIFEELKSKKLPPSASAATYSSTTGSSKSPVSSRSTRCCRE